MKLLTTGSLLLAFVLMINAVPFDIWSDCSTEDDKDRAIIQTIIFKPDPPKIGEMLTVTGSFITEETITNGSSAKLAVKLDGYVLYSRTFDLCHDVLNQGCPLAPGEHIATVKYEVPKDAPTGHFTLNARAADSSGREVACINVDVELEPM